MQQMHIKPENLDFEVPINSSLELKLDIEAIVN